MKRLFLTGALIAVAVIVLGQAPHAFNYQAILRNTDGSVKANEELSIQINVVNNTGVSAYVETHDAQTSEFGLVNLKIGEGASSDDFTAISWEQGPYSIDISVNGSLLGTSPLLIQDILPRGKVHQLDLGLS